MSRRDIIAIGGSHGSVEAVKRLCRQLPADLGAALLIVIHVGARGNDLLAEIFAEGSSIGVSTAREGDPLRRGHAYVAPADHHLLVIGDVVRLGRGPRENMARPAVDPLLRSVGAACGPRAIGVVLSGMLNDGASGLADLKRCGGLTVVQNPREALAPGMPREALRNSAIDYRTPLADLPALLVELTSQVAGPSVEIPADIQTEIEIALGTARSAILPESVSRVTALTCPSCGGVLSQMIREPPLRFRCQVGHTFTAEVLAGQKEGALDEAARVALRIMQERVLLTEKMAEEARRSGRTAAASSYEKWLEESRAYAATLRQALSDKKL